MPEFFDPQTVEAALQAIGFAFQAGVVWFAVFLIRKWQPIIKERYPVALMALAAALPAGAAAAETALSGFFGTPITLQAIVEAVGSGAELGVGAILLDQLGKQFRKQSHAKRVQTRRLP